jgi:hypothetical protein
VSDENLVATLEMQLFDYFQHEKVNRLFNQSQEFIKKAYQEKRSSEKLKGVKGDGGLGGLSAVLGITGAIGGEIHSNTNVSEEASFEITEEYKLRALWVYLYEQNQVADLNIIIRNGHEVSASIKLVKFFGKNGILSFVNPNDNPHDNDTQIRVLCHIEGYNVQFFCSRKFFSGSSVLFDIDEAVTRDIRGIASIKKIDHERKEIFLNPLAF